MIPFSGVRFPVESRNTEAALIALFFCVPVTFESILPPESVRVGRVSSISLGLSGQERRFRAVLPDQQGGRFVSAVYSSNANSEVSDKILQRVLADLAREDQRTGQLYGKDRKFERKSIALQVEVVSISQGKGILESRTLVWTRNLSRSGVSIVSPSPLKCSEIGVHLLDGDQGPIWMHGQVVRERPIQEGFWELGVKFIGPLAQPA